LGRLAFILFVLTIAVIAVLYFAGIEFPISQDEAIQRELRLHTTTEQLDAHVSQALDTGDVDDASVYADVATYMSRKLSPATQAKLDAALTTSATVMRNAGQFASGFVTGAGTSTAGLAGALASDVTVVGDIRDIASEGGNMIQGKPYSELVLGLSVLGVAATVATVATGGGGVVAKAGVSLLKVAKRAGTLTLDFTRELERLVTRAVDTQELTRVLKGTNLNDLRATEDAVTTYARGIKDAEIFPVLGRLGRMSEKAGPGETVRLLRYVHSTRDLEDVGDMTERLGKKTRGIIEITGKTSLRAFRTSLNIIQFLVERVMAFGAWLLGLLGLSAVRGLSRERA